MLMRLGGSISGIVRFYIGGYLFFQAEDGIRDARVRVVSGNLQKGFRGYCLQEERRHLFSFRTVVEGAESQLYTAQWQARNVRSPDRIVRIQDVAARPSLRVHLSFAPCVRESSGNWSRQMGRDFRRREDEGMRLGTGNRSICKG